MLGALAGAPGMKSYITCEARSRRRHRYAVDAVTRWEAIGEAAQAYIEILIDGRPVPLDVATLRRHALE